MSANAFLLGSNARDAAMSWSKLGLLSFHPFSRLGVYCQRLQIASLKTRERVQLGRINLMAVNRISTSLLAVLLLLFSALSLAAEEVGQVLMVTGPASRLGADGADESLADKSAIFEGDTISTGDGSVMQLKMVDNALLILQPKTTLVIHRYHYPMGKVSEYAARIDLVKGRVRSVTGDLGESNHDAFRLNTPIAAIGIRGTDFEAATDGQTTRVRLHRGAIVIAPLDDQCDVAALGPCSTDGSLLLTDELGSPVAELRATDSAPRIIELPDFDLDDQSLNDQHDEEHINSENRADEVVDNIQGQTPGGGGPGGGGNPDGGFTPVEVPEEWQDQIHWGRWETVSFLTTGPTVDELVASDKEILFKNDLFVLFRDEFVSLGNGQASFQLQSAQAGVLTATAFTPVVIKNGSLMIDFDDRKFQTQLAFTGGAVEGLVLQSNGTVDNLGLFRGQGSMEVYGGLAGDNSQAGYLFIHDIDNETSLQGATQWQQP
jgi:FecR protein